MPCLEAIFAHITFDSCNFGELAVRQRRSWRQIESIEFWDGPRRETRAKLKVIKERKMKKIIAAAAGLAMVAGTASSVLALENEFGGYWRTRMFTQIDFQEDGSYSIVDTRTRLYYTAKFNEGFKFVNKFEMDAVWGGPGTSYGDVGADGKSFEIKNSYADVDAFGANFKIGVQGVRVARGLLIDTDASAFIATFKAGDIVLPFAWMRVTEDEVPGQEERDHYAVLPVIQAGEGLTIQPMFIYDKQQSSDWNNYYVGANVDMKTDAFSAWGTGVYQFGEVMDQDLSAFLLAAGASAGPVHGQVFYATGDDDATDGDIDAFVNPAGASYYWAEILGAGTFDPGRANGPYDRISNAWAANVGVKVKPSDKLTVGADVWYAALAEDDAAGETDLGIEFDVKATYAIYENLALDLVAAYLIAGDAYGEDDPIEVGARVSLAF